MKRSLGALAGILLGGAIASTAMAQSGGGTCMHNHSGPPQRFSAGPSMGGNRQFLANYPGPQSFMNNSQGMSGTMPPAFGPPMYPEEQNELAQRGSPGAADPGAGPGPVGRFDRGYLDEHPEVAQQLADNPRLADNPQFLASHPGLDDYLAAHPEVRKDLQTHPYRFMNREAGYEQYEDRPHPLSSTDNYLDRHPEVAQQLEKHPGLVDDPNYMKNHPGLQQFMAHHPVARQEWRSHPHRYMNRETRWEKNHPNQ